MIGKRILLGAVLACGMMLFGGSAYASEPIDDLESYRNEEAVVVESSNPQARINNTDTRFKFLLNSTGATSGTTGRKKDTDSSVYIKIESWGGRSPRLYVDGSNGGSWYNCTQGTYHANKTGEYEIYNYVNEHGYSYARLTSWAESAPGNAYGLWSPDCVGSFPRL